MTSKRVLQLLLEEEEEDDDILLSYLYGKRRCEIPPAKMEHGADESVKEQLHSEMTLKTEVEEAAQSSAHVDTKIPAAKMEHGADESVREKLHSEMTLKTEVEEAAQSPAHVDTKIPAAKIEHGADESVKEQLRSEMTIKTEVEKLAQSSAHVDTKVTLPSPTSTRGIVARTSVSADDVAQDQLLHIKEELEDADLDIGPTVLQHMDSRYISHQIDLNAIKQESTIRLDAGEVVSGIKDVQELHSAVRDGTIEDSQTDNKIILCKYSGQIIKEEDFGQAPVKPCLGRQTDHHLRLQRQYRAVSSNGFKCEASDRTFLKPHLLSVHNKLHQQCSSKTSMTSSSIALGPSNLRRDETAKVKKNSFECEKPYYCDMCDARFAYKPALIDHTRIHTGAKPYHCNKCDARFSQNFTLIRHMKVHTGEKPYHCDTCDARFTQKRSLFLHMTIHTGEKPFHCNTCDARFARKLYLIKHMSVHTEKKPYHCDTCDRGFTRKIALTMHMIIHTGEGVPL